MNVKANSKLGLLLTIFILVVCVSTCSYLLIRRCLPWECAPSRSLDVFAFSLPLSFFPPGSTGGVMFTPSELDLAKNKGDMAIFWDRGNGKAIYIVRQFRTINQASRFYQSIESISYNKNIEIDLSANEYSVGCGFSEFSGYICELNARCLEFVFSLNVTISDEMTESDFNDVIDYIEGQLKDKLSACQS